MGGLLHEVTGCDMHFALISGVTITACQYIYPVRLQGNFASTSKYALRP